MTLEALYQAIDGDYNQALKVLRVEKLLDKQYYVGYPSPEPELPADEEPHESER